MELATKRISCKMSRLIVEQYPETFKILKAERSVENEVCWYLTYLNDDDKDEVLTFTSANFIPKGFYVTIIDDDPEIMAEKITDIIKWNGHLELEIGEWGLNGDDFVHQRMSQEIKVKSIKNETEDQGKLPL